MTIQKLQPGDFLDGRYQIIETLAQGGFGQTYTATDQRRPGHPKCVVKQLQPENRSPRLLETAERLFITEAETLERLGNHEQIPRLLAYFQEDSEFYLIQEFIDGETLTHEMKLGESWPEQKVYELLRSVLQVLAFLHQNGVIHRDIKPDNIIRRYRDQSLVLVDFGTVKQVRNQMTAQGQMLPTVSIGTPGYMPTEQSRGNPRHNSDIYALGIIGIQAATGLSLNQLQEDPETGEIIWEPWAKVSPQLSAVLNKMVRYHFKDRYQTAVDVLQDLTESGAITSFKVSTETVKDGNQGTAAATPNVATSTNVQPNTSSQGRPSEAIANNTPQRFIGVRAPEGMNAGTPDPTGPDPTVGLASQVRTTPVMPQRTPPAVPQGNDTARAIYPPAVDLSTQAYSPNSHSADNNSPYSPSVHAVGSAPTGNWMEPLKLASIFGAGSWVLAAALLSFLGTIWLATGFWLAVVALAAFLVLAKGHSFQAKFLGLIIAMISTGVSLMIIPTSIEVASLFSVGFLGLLTVLIVTIFAGALAFILFTLAQSFS